MTRPLVRSPSLISFASVTSFPLAQCDSTIAPCCARYVPSIDLEAAGLKNSDDALCDNEQTWSWCSLWVRRGASLVFREHLKDRRVQKTERLLREALGSLIHEKNYDSIVVREILERANVGRSALYAHF